VRSGRGCVGSFGRQRCFCNRQSPESDVVSAGHRRGVFKMRSCHDAAGGGRTGLWVRRSRGRMRPLLTAVERCHRADDGVAA
jgi:hypothetical protein